MAMLEQSYSASSSNNREGAKKRNNVVVSSARSEGSSRTEKSKKHMVRGSSDGKGLQLLQGPKQAPRPPLKWKKRFFSADEHEVPSGPNPISNK